MKTRKNEAQQIFDKATNYCDSLTFQQINTVGCDWLFVEANEQYHVQLTLSPMDVSMRVEYFDRFCNKQCNDTYFLTRPVYAHLEKQMRELQEKRILKL